MRNRALASLVVLQVAALVLYLLLHSPLVPWLTHHAGVRTPDFCYFVCT